MIDLPSGTPARRAAGPLLAFLLALSLPVVAACDPRPAQIDEDPDAGTQEVSLGPAVEARAAFTMEGVDGAALPGDVTGDGVPDIATLAWGDGVPSLAVVAGPIDEAAIVATVQSPDGNEVPRPVEVEADLNDDGQGDLVVADGFAGVLRVFLGPLQGELSTEDSWLVVVGSRASFFGFAAVWAGDLDGDGHSDLVLGAPGEPEEACQITPDGTLVFPGPLDGGVLTPADATTVIFDAGTCDGFSLNVIDITGDGHVDLIQGARSGPLHVFSGPLPAGSLTRSDADVVLTGDVGYGPAVRVHSRGGRVEVLAGWGQLDGRGLARIVGPLDHGEHGTEVIEHTWLDEGLFASDLQLALGDINGNGHDDVVFTDSYQGPVRIIYGPAIERLSNFAEADLSVSVPPVEDGYREVHVGQVLGDERPELIIVSGGLLTAFAFDPLP